jgi:hypothetical protein
MANVVQTKLTEYLELSAKDAEQRAMRAKADQEALSDLKRRIERTCFNCGEYFYRNENYEAHIASCGQEPAAEEQSS